MLFFFFTLTIDQGLVFLLDHRFKLGHYFGREGEGNMERQNFSTN